MSLGMPVHDLIVRMLVGVPVTIAGIALVATLGSLYLRRRRST